MDEDYYDEFNDSSIEDSDEERPAYSGAVQPYTFEPTISEEEATARDTAVKTLQSDLNGFRRLHVSEWYVVRSADFIR